MDDCWKRLLPMLALTCLSCAGAAVDTAGRTLPDTPFWLSHRMEDEPVLFVQEAGQPVATGRLLFTPGTAPRITHPEGTPVYVEGQDYTWQPGTATIALTAASRIPFKTAAQMQPPPGSPQSLRGLLWSEGRFFHDLQVLVTYEHADTWPDTPPVERLPRSLGRLRARLPFTVVTLGDSITEGYNASGFAKSKAPPFQPAYPQLVADLLRQRFSADVTLVNLGVAGTKADWGLGQVARVAAAKPHLVILAFGMNHGEPAAAFEAVMRRLRDAVQTACPEADLVLVASMTGNPRAFATDHFLGYRAALGRLEAEQVALADVTTPWLELLKRKGFADLSGNHFNHPNDFGHRLYAQVIGRLFPAAAGERKP